MASERRERDLMRDFLAPIVASVVIGIGAVVMTFKYNEGETVAWRNSIETQIESMKVIMQAVQANQIELAARGSWMVGIDKSINSIESRIGRIETSRFTKEDADSTTRRLDREIELLWEKLDGE